MKLLVDIGNTRIKSAVWDDGVVRPLDVLVHRGEVRTALIRLIEGLPSGTEQILVAAVAGKEVLEELKDAMAVNSSVEVLFARTQKEFRGLVNSYSDPRRMGVDRWLAMIGAASREECPLCVVDCGSAITIDVVSRDRMHKGGYIVPGLKMAEQSLLSKTEDIIVNTSVSFKALSWGTSTEQAVQMGVLVMAVDFIRSSVNRITEQEGIAPKLFLTGGDAEVVCQHLDVESIHSPLLVLEGLALYGGLNINF